ncbi:GTP cyclohydrolase II [Nocardia otitidiscaviarum]|uniref:GTP cyclohydrolase II n=1 Tax=Nocardia otitidiscaviarum TaxID=1823 RepID=UPI002456E595|nr:GTP cyclohydrolase II [Nocardia otitidiscaviarum]
MPNTGDNFAPHEVRHRFTRRGRTLGVRVFRVSGSGDSGYLFVFGDPGDGCLVRIHSQCLYGEAMGSDSCDCGPELDLALDLIYWERAGVLVYLEQEGRGAGLMVKAAGYAYSQAHRTDTFESYERLGYPHDSRNYDAAIESLHALGFLRSIKLLTNNPCKVQRLRDAGFRVERIRLYSKPRGPVAAAYLDAKRRRTGFAHGLPASRVWMWLTVAKWGARLAIGCAVAWTAWHAATRLTVNSDAAAAVMAFVLAIASTRVRWSWRSSRPISAAAAARWDTYRAGFRLARHRAPGVNTPADGVARDTAPPM